MTEPLAAGYAPEWLTLRAPADTAARSVALADLLSAHLAEVPTPLIRDLGCGTGAMARWLAPRLPGRQHWILTDVDPALLTIAAGAMPPSVTASTDLGDLTRLTDLTGTAVVTGSALLDLLTAAEVATLASACLAAGCAALFALSVVGRVELDPVDRLDEEIVAAFNAHQRRSVDGRSLLGPDAVPVAAAEFARQGATVHRRPSPWHLGPEHGPLIGQWLSGWVSAAAEHEPGLPAASYLERRLAEAAAGTLTVTVHHEDLLALPPGS